MKKLSRPEKLTIIGLIFTIIGAIATVIIVPEFREFLDLDKKQDGKEVSAFPSFQVNYFYRERQTGQFKPIVNGTTLHSGDHYKIVFTPDADAYVYIFQIDSKSQIFQLFPMREFKGVRVNNTEVSPFFTKV